MTLDDLRRRIPVEDQASYDAAYAEAVAAERLGDAVHRLRAAAGLSESALAVRMGVDASEVERAEEGDPATPMAFFLRLCRALGVSLTVALGDAVVDMGQWRLPDDGARA
jgi:transcriptional regulator with XRE-family HTH domain